MPAIAICNVKISFEVPLLLLFFAFQFSDSIKTNLIIFRTCYVTLGYNKSDCALLGGKNVDNSTANLEKIVEPYAAVVNMVRTLTETCFSAILCLFIGPWSDRFGRKPFLTTPVIGYTLFFILFAVFSALENISPWYSVVCTIPIYLTGGGSSYITVLLCYITDVTNEQNRGLKMGIFEALLAVGIFLGNITSSYAFIATNYPTIFLISAACCFLNVLFTVIFVPESLPNPETQGRLRGLFQITNIKDMIKTTFKRRSNYDRCVVLTCVLMLTIFILEINGDGALTFLFLREKFLWSLQEYTLFSAAHNVTWVIGTVIGIYILHKLFKVPETIMIVIGFFSMFIGLLGMGLATNTWEIYAASFSRGLGGVLSPMVRSLVSKIVPNEEVGKVFALIVVSESLVGIAGSPIFTAIYNSTISINPAIFNFVGAAIYALEICLALGIVFLRPISTSNIIYNEIVNENINEERCDTNVVVT